MSTEKPLVEMDEIHKEIDLTQDLIKEMRNLSFKVKAWTISTFGGVIAFSEGMFSKTEQTEKFVEPNVIPLVLVIVIVAFWFLDGFFLQAEKRTRAIYNWNVANREKTRNHLYDLHTLKRTDGDGEEVDMSKTVDTVVQTMLNITLAPFYVIPLIFTVFMLVYKG